MINLNQDSFIVFLNKLSGRETLEEINSRYNGKIKVVKELGKISVQAGNLTQSGGLVKKVWEKVVKSIKTADSPKILILGLGSGTLASMLSRRNPQSFITGVDIDPKMIEIGYNYLDLSRVKNLDVVIDNAVRFIGKEKNNYDLIFVDLFHGYKAPPEIETSNFLREIINKLTPGGQIYINRLFYTPETKASAHSLIRILENINLGEVSLIRSLTNLIIHFSQAGIQPSLQV